MKKTTTKKLNVKTLAMTGLSLSLLLAVQIIGLPNLLTGIAVNAIFIFVLLYLGFRSALFLCILSPLGGLLSGHLPVIMYPLAPVIVVGNLLYIYLYACFGPRLWLVRIFIAAIAKSSFIGLLGYSLLYWLEILAKVKWLILPVLGIQFITAFLGALLGERLNRSLAPVADQLSAEPS
jgi:hypothetical protein